MMTDAPLPLSPDDDSQEQMALAAKTTAPAMPYAWVALLVAVIIMVFTSFMLPMVRTQAVAIFAALLGVLLYILFELTRPRLCPFTLTMVSAEVGMILSFPAFLFSAALRGETLQDVATLVFWIGIAGLVGWLTARTLGATQYPTLVPPIAFLLLFVLTGLAHLLV